MNSLITRRSLIKVGLGVSAMSTIGAGCSAQYQPEDKWWRGDLQHILPLVSHNSFNIKLSFNTAYQFSPVLRFGNRTIKGRQQDSLGRFWAFRVSQLSPDTEYQLELIDQSGRALCEPWPLKTFPSPNQEAERLKIISYTCAGGPDLPVFPGNHAAFKPAAYRRRLFELILGKEPDLVIANGDHIYWDYRSWASLPENSLGKNAVRLFLQSWGGKFEEEQAIIGTDNEAVLTAIADEQIASIYGVAFRSTPILFITDDHDYFENDDATPALVTFPPKPFNWDLRQSLQKLYFPEYIFQDAVDSTFPGLIDVDGVRLSSHFGSIRYGDLFSGICYDCGGMLDLGGERAGLFPPMVESWLVDQTRQEDTLNLAHFPSHPVGWTAGKWREWYPDLLKSDNSLVAKVDDDGFGGKYLWQSGWWWQHQRLMRALASQKRRAALVVSGDLHLLGAGVIARSGDLDLNFNPVYSILSGPIGVGDLGWLSRARGVAVKVPKELEIDELMPPVERNGFTLLTMARHGCSVTLYSCPEGYVPPEKLSVVVAASFEIVS